MTTIEGLLARRSDLSTFLVHLTRDREGATAKDALLSILKAGKIEARSPMGPAVAKLEAKRMSTTSQRCVAMTETPIEHVSLLTGPIEGRACQFEPFGVAITKKQGRRLEVNPIWYLDATPRTTGKDWLTKPWNDLIDAAIATKNFDSQPVAKLTPFVEQMGTWPSSGTRKEFWWEREWRHVGDFVLPDHFMVLCPEEDHGDVQQHAIGLPLIDPRWSLEQIIGHLAQFDPRDIGPL